MPKWVSLPSSIQLLNLISIIVSILATYLTSLNLSLYFMQVLLGLLLLLAAFSLVLCFQLGQPANKPKASQAEDPKLSPVNMCEHVLAEIFDFAKVGTWQYELPHKKTIWDDGQKKLFGLGKDDPIPDGFEAFLRYVHPEDRAYFENQYERLFRPDTPQDMQNKEPQLYLEFPFRIYPKNSQKVKYLLGRAQTVFEGPKLAKITGINVDITPLKEIEQKLTEKTLLIEAIANVLPGRFFVLDANKFQVDYTNVEFTDDFLSPEELRTLGVDKYFELIHPEDRAKVKQYYKAILENTHDNMELIYRVKNRDQAYRWLKVYLQPYRNHPEGKQNKVLGVALDITREKHITEQLNYKNQLLSSLFDNLPIGLQLYDQEGTVLMMNKKKAETFGLPSTDYGIGEYNVLQDQTSLDTQLRPFYERAYAGETVYLKERQVDLTMPQNKDWETKPQVFIFNIILYPLLDQNGKVQVLVSIYQDVKEQYNQKQELLQTQQELEAALRVKEEFLSNMSHEIRNPLNNIVGLIHLLTKEQMMPHQQEYLETLKFSANHLLELVNNLLDYSKIEAGEAKVQKQVFSLPLLCQALISSFQAQASQKGLSLDLILEDRLANLQVQSDKVMLYQILSNLLGNALKFTQVGGVQLRIVFQTESPAQITLRFEVEDSGSGIPEDQLAHIFERFTQVRASEQIKPQGTGLGLSICRALLHLLGSQLEVSSEVGQGSTFFFQLTLEKQKDSSLSKSISPQEASPLPKTILVAEDNLINQQVIRQILQGWDFRVEIAQNGLEAIDILQEKSVDLVLMDLQMPEMDGKQAIALIKEHDKLKDLPIIVMTAEVSPRIEKAVKGLGANQVVHKPISPDQLHQVILEHISAEENMTRINENTLNTIAKGDQDFIENARQIFLLETESFIRDYEAFLGEEDQASLANLLHNYNTSLSLFGMNHIQPALRRGQDLLDAEADSTTLKTHLKEVKNLIQTLIKQLKDRV